MINLFTKTWINDYSWLKLSMKSVLKLCKDPVHWTIVGDHGSTNDIEAIVSQAVKETNSALAYKIIEAPTLWPECVYIGNGYLAQQWMKMNAHRAMGDKIFWNWDCDVIAAKPFSMESFCGKSGRPIYWFSQFNSIINGPYRAAHEARMAMMKEILNINEVSLEYMRCMPIPMNGQILKSGSERHVWVNSFEMMKRGDSRFSEFNVIGLFSHLHFPDAYEWRNAETSGPMWNCGYIEDGKGTVVFQDHALICQFWSWSGVTQQAIDFVNGL